MDAHRARMTRTDVLLLLLTIAVATIIAMAAAITTKADGKSLATALTVAGGAFATTMIVIYAVIGVYDEHS